MFFLRLLSTWQFGRRVWGGANRSHTFEKRPVMIDATLYLADLRLPLRGYLKLPQRSNLLMVKSRNGVFRRERSALLHRRFDYLPRGKKAEIL